MKRSLLIVFAVIVLATAWNNIFTLIFSGIYLLLRILWLVAGGMIATFIILIFKKASRSVWILYASLLALLVLLLPDAAYLPFSNQTTLDGPIGFMMMIGFPVAIILAALLFHSGFAIQNSPANENSSQLPLKNANLTSASLLILGAVLLLKLLDNFYKLMVWDTTYDPLGILWLILPSTVVLFAGMALLGFLPWNRKWISTLFFLLIPTFIVLANRAEKVDFRLLTESRAEKVRAAIEAYHAQEGVYPESLGGLIPRFALSLSKPVILFGQDWCYESGDSYYRLGYLYRDHWSSPILYGKIHASGGHSPSKTDICQPAIDRYRSMNPGWAYTIQDYGYPTPTPDIGR